jgi:hypothetical protein
MAIGDSVGRPHAEAWYANDEQRTLVRYDNSDLVFLESIS